MQHIETTTQVKRVTLSHKIVGHLLVISMLTSCEVLNDPAIAGLVGAGSGAILGNALGGNNREIKTLVGATAGALIAIAIQKQYNATLQERKLAEQRAKQAWSKSSIQQAARKQNADRCAVAVRRPETGKKVWMITDRDGDPVNNDLLELNSNPKSGNVATVRGHKTVFYDCM